MILPTVWFILVGTLLTGYAVLDGYDLGVGILYLGEKKDADRRALMGAIGPVWDGNEVWLVTAGGALFAAFPPVYATVFSGFYLAFTLFLVALIFRAVSLEFRNREDHPLWKKTCDLGFALGSALAALLLGVAFGNIVEGLYLSAETEYGGDFLGLLNPFALLFGLASLAFFASHGALYLVLKTEGGLQERMKKRAAWGAKAIPLSVLAAIVSAYLFAPRTQSSVANEPLLALAGCLAVFCGILIGPVLRKNPSRAFYLSCTSLVLTLVFFFWGLYPNLVYSPLSPDNSLTVVNASSSPETLKVMLWIALLTFPLVVFYTYWVHRVFKGPSRPDDHGY